MLKICFFFEKQVYLTFKVFPMKYRVLLTIVITLSFLSCKTQYRVAGIQGTNVRIDSTFDTRSDKKMHELVQTYKVRLDQKMDEIIGTSAQFMTYGRPESLLTNLSSDVMKAYGDEHLEGGADVAVMNVNGHRSNLPKGTITVRNLYETYSFDNAITFLELKGTDLKDIFNAYARLGGAGISSNVKLVIDGTKVKNVTLDNKPIDDNKIYKIVTLDYLADGNDSMRAFRNALKTHFTGITLRDVMIDYVREQTRQGKEISSKLDGRIIVLNSNNQ